YKHPDLIGMRSVLVPEISTIAVNVLMPFMIILCLRDYINVSIETPWLISLPLVSMREISGAMIRHSYFSLHLLRENSSNACQHFNFIELP
ncbi:hypothetical protein L9F63_023050, partial [Diploptera punctata]